MVADDVRSTREPEVRHLGEDLALARDGVRQDDVERGQAVGGDDEQVVRVRLVDVAHLAAMEQLQVGKFRFEQGGLSGAGGHCRVPGRARQSLLT
jgi:hypothetical protein